MPESVTSDSSLPLLESAAKTNDTYTFTFWSAGSFVYHSFTDATQKGPGRDRHARACPLFWDWLPRTAALLAYHRD